MGIKIPLKEIANIGKSALILAVGLCENYKKEIYVEEIDFGSCPDTCPFKNIEGEIKQEYCKNNCSICTKKLPEVVYVNERHKYKLQIVDIVEQKRLSKLQLQQFLLYHFLNIDSNGIAKYVSVKEVATLLNCTTRSVRDNNEALRELGLIAFTRINIDLFSVAILGYKKYRETRENNGTGYIPMTKEFFHALINFENVNTMRLAIRLLLKFDDMSFQQEDSSCIYSYDDIKHFMPTNIRYKNIIDKTLEGVESIFEIEKRASFVVFKLKDGFNGKVQRTVKEKIFNKEVCKTLSENNLTDKQSSINDLVKLSMEYGLNSVNEAVNLYVSDYKNKMNNSVNNFGGFIRELIRKQLFKTLIA